MKSSLVSVVLAGCCMLLSQFQQLRAATYPPIQVSLTGDTATTKFQFARNIFEAYNQAGDFSEDPSGINESYITSFNSDGSVRTQTSGQYAYAPNTATAFTFIIDAVARSITEQVGTGANMMVNTTTFRSDAFFDTISFGLVTQPDSPVGTQRANITEINGQPYNLQLSASSPSNANEQTYVSIWWDQNLPQQSVRLSGTYTPGTSGGAFNQVWDVVPLTTSSVPEPSTWGLVLAGICGLMLFNRPRSQRRITPQQTKGR